MKRFRSPKESLGDFDAEAIATLIAAAADVALVLDGAGVIQDVAFGSRELAQECGSDWHGRPWIDTVTAESRDKITELLDEAGVQAASRWRQVNHPSDTRGADIPVLYSAVRPGDGDRIVAIGRDLRAVAALQQRLVSAQQSMERDYARLRHAETRYRLLFQVASEAVLVVEAATGRILEANPAVTELLGRPVKRLIGRTVPELFDEAGADVVRGLLAAARRTGRADDARVRASEPPRDFDLSASLFRQDGGTLVLVRLSPVAADGSGKATGRSRILDVIENLPDGLVVTDPELKVMMANAAFLDLAEAATEAQVLDGALERWLGRSVVDLDILVASLREHGSVRHFATTLQGEHGGVAEVEVSAVSVLDGERPCFGFTVRPVGRRLPAAPPAAKRELPRSIEQMMELVGRVPMKELIRETTDVIERMCIEAALELADDNRASAADMLGLSRQSLYVKLRRYGLGDLGDEPLP